jgi:phytoene desaturase
MNTTLRSSPARTRSRRAPHAIVIGAGLGGLAVAVRLLTAGMRVTVLEGQPAAGGRAGRIQDAGFTFDTGPSLITMPELIEDLFALAGTSLSRELRLHALDPFYRISWEDERRTFLFSGDRDSMREQIAQFDPADGERYDDFLAASRRIYEQALLVAGTQSFLRLSDFLTFVPRMVQLGALRTVDGFVGRFFHEPHVRQAFDFHPLFIGGAPFRVPAVYAALAYLQIASGVWYAEGGVYALVEALARVVEASGSLHTNCRVTGILHDGQRVSGVQTEQGETIEADYVVSNADVVTMQRMLGRQSRTPRLTMSCYLLYLGMNREFPQLHHHNLLVGQDYRGFIRDVTVGGRVPANLSLYVHAPSRTERAMAAPGGESISVLLPVPNLSASHDWSRLEPELGERVLDLLESDAGLGLSGLRDSIVVRHSWTPLDFRDRFGAAEGNAFGPEPILFQSAYFRQPNRDRHLRGLYYVGAGTHPGAGIPGVLMTAGVTATLLQQDEATVW